MKKKFKVGDRVEFTNEALQLFFPKGTKFNKGVVEECDWDNVKIQRDHDGILYRGHESKWWSPNYWKKVI